MGFLSKYFSYCTSKILSWKIFKNIQNITKPQISNQSALDIQKSIIEQIRFKELATEAKYFKDSLFFLERDLAVRIESSNDAHFWRFVFQEALPNFRILFYPQSMTRKPGTKGKSQLMLLQDFADKELALCVDSDYDYLLDNTNLKKSFIFQTYFYSIENYWSFAEGLEIGIEKTTGKSINFPFATYFKIYSSIIYDWLIYSLYSEKMNHGYLPAARCGMEVGAETISDLRVLKFKL